VSDDVISIQWVPPEYLEENDFNPNVMAEAEFEAMKAEMKEDPAKFWINNQIRVTPREAYHGDPDQPFDRFVIIDGAHRWRGAMHLNLDKVPIFIRLLNRAQARRECFRINRQRGTIDPLKVAEMYRIDLEEGSTQAKIAEDYGVSESTVSYALGITKLPESILGFYRSPEAVFAKYKKLEWETMVEGHVNSKVLEAIDSYIEAEGVDPSDEEVADMEEAIREHAERWPRYDRPDMEPGRPLGKSHLELLGTLPTEELQISFALRIMSGDESLRRLEDQAGRVKEEYEKNEFLENARELARIKTCPECGKRIKKARETDGEILVACSEYNFEAHWWNVKTTREEYDEAKRALEVKKKEPGDEEKKEPLVKLWFKHTLEPEVIDETLGGFALEFIRGFESVSHVGVRGVINGRPIEFKFEGERAHRVFSVSFSPELEEPDYNERTRVLGSMFAYNNPYFEDVLRGADAWPHEKLYFTYKSGDWKKGPYHTRFEIGHEHERHAEELIRALQVFLSNRYVAGAPGILPLRMVGGSTELAREFIEYFEKKKAEKEET
jgi:hypothetical protein